ncbi:hypothetical protein BDN71DRAFT_1483977 [Pleurotus eryngii]|uniref:DUF659 domain-containing protein n=1 Tax=Pleurotus eryngii TaxID=5323 RepID=A0A9P6DDK7_PLEER|nr:hypothetical protein BDN71DRAFT_1483977 [Pleurotus eryngii]
MNLAGEKKKIVSTTELSVSSIPVSKTVPSIVYTAIQQVGPSQFTGICSDDTGNTCVAHKKVQKKYPWILNMADPCHHLNDLTKDICNLPHFKGIIKDVHHTMKFFKKSTIANSHLKKAHRVHMILCGLVSIGKTHFWSIYHATASVKWCLPAIRDICGSHLIKIPDVNSNFSVTEPLAKSITCLESSHATAVDVYVFWLAIMASMNNTLQSNDVAENIRHLCNYRFNQSIHDGPSDIFITSFFLDPCLCLIT